MLLCARQGSKSSVETELSRSACDMGITLKDKETEAQAG